VRNVEATLRELARVLRPGGTLVLSDLHPVASQRGWRRSFVGAAGERIVIEAPPPPVERVLAALDAAGFGLERRLEPVIDERLRAAFEDAGRRDFEALSGTPLLQLYRARKRGWHAR
jgi:malonyl-CoA O-methyltransferase